MAKGKSDSQVHSEHHRQHQQAPIVEDYAGS